MHFDSTISLGNVISVATMLIALYGFHIANVKRIMRINFRVNQMWSVFKKRFHISDEDSHIHQDDDMFSSGDE